MGGGGRRLGFESLLGARWGWRHPSSYSRFNLHNNPSMGVRMLCGLSLGQLTSQEPLPTWVLRAGTVTPILTPGTMTCARTRVAGGRTWPQPSNI